MKTMHLTNRFIIVFSSVLLAAGCKVRQTNIDQSKSLIPSTYNGSNDTTNSAYLQWRIFFKDPQLQSLIDTALKNNRELLIYSQEVMALKAEIKEKKAEYIPFINFSPEYGLEKEPRFTRHGALDEHLDIEPGKRIPNPLQDYRLKLDFAWEIDVWKKLRSAKKAAEYRYLAGIEGRNFLISQLVSEISESYYELLALDNLLELVNQNISIQEKALEVVQQQKNAAKVTQLAVNRFEAQLNNTIALKYQILQKIQAQENKLRFLTGSPNLQIQRNKETLFQDLNDSIFIGVPLQLFYNRPDIRRAEKELMVADLDVYSARMAFMPAFGLVNSFGLGAYSGSVLFNPESMMLNGALEMITPLINRNALNAMLQKAKARQKQAIYNYEQAMIKAFLEVKTQVANIENFRMALQRKIYQVDILNQSVGISNNLFLSAKADYAEVLLTQREALEAKVELIENYLQYNQSRIMLYKSLGGGWK